MKKNKIVIIICVIIAIILIVLACLFVPSIIQKIKIANAKIVVVLKEDLNVPFNSEAKVSDFITEINGVIEDDYKIDTLTLGEKEISFKYTNEDDIPLKYSYKINVVDKTGPIIWLGSSYSVSTNFSGDLAEKIMCVDDTDDYPECSIEGDYDTTKVGTYKLKYVAKDKYGNESEQPFTLTVYKPSSGGSSSSSSKYNFSDAYQKFKNENTKIGIDVSGWQGDIDFDKLKEAGVEFAIIRVGSKYSVSREYFVDSKFQRNIEGFNRVGIPVGIYFYSYAKTSEEAREDALWVIDKIKDYKVDLPIAYDWENWSSYNSYHLSLLSLTNNAKAFLDTVKEHGYQGMLYSSKSYLEALWMDTGYPIWLAHYTSQTNYEGDYIFWQHSCVGRVSGIYGDVDLDVMYLKENKNE